MVNNKVFNYFLTCGGGPHPPDCTFEDCDCFHPPD